MNEEQKAIAEDIFYMFDQGHIAPVEALNAMAALLQELVDAPEPEPVARVTGYYAGYLSIETADGRVLPAGTALYAAPPHQSEHHLEMVNPPAPSVPDEQLQAAFDRGLKAGNEQSVAQQIEIHKLHDLLAAPQPEPYIDYGMTLRDYFAAKAMLALLTHHGGYTGDEAHPSSIPCLREDVLDVDSLAQYAYLQADAMLAERGKE